MTNPGARYAANVTSVIRITTKRSLQGFAADAQTVCRVNGKGRASVVENIFAGYHHGRWDVRGQLYGAYTHQQDDKSLTEAINLDDRITIGNSIVQEYTNANPYAKLSASFAANDSSSVGASVSLDRYSKNLGEGDMIGSVHRNETVEDTLLSHYASPANSTQCASNIYYTAKIGPFSIDFNTDLLWKKKTEDMRTRETCTNAAGQTSQGQVNTTRETTDRMMAAKLVVEEPLWRGVLSEGLEWSAIRRQGCYAVTPEDVVDGENSQMRERMLPAFVSYGRKVGRLSVQAGLRCEHLRFKYYDHGVLMPGQSKRYTDWFPSVSVLWPIRAVSLQLTYASDIARPSYYELRDGVQFDNRYTYESGNPFLNLSVSRNLSASATWRWLYLSAMYSRVSDEICRTKT